LTCSSLSTYLSIPTNYTTKMTNYSDFIKAQAKLLGLTYKEAQKNALVKELYRNSKKKSMNSIEFLASSGFLLEFKSDDEINMMIKDAEVEVNELNAEYKKNNDEDTKQKYIKALKHQMLVCRERSRRLDKMLDVEEALLKLKITM
jgi:hypothetical protein